MSTRSGILAWRIPWTEEPDELQFMGLQSQTRLTLFCSPKWLYQFIFPPTVQKSPFFFTPSPACVICRHLTDGHSDQCEVIPHYSFDLHQRGCASFHVPSGYLSAFFREMSIQVFSIGIFFFNLKKFFFHLFLLVRG